ncbi:hypothetical protein HDU76_000276 [Blyttiomyces sp. JEL0837]|nr:hypothetical protein HDU76_000276 [Blyttiomyces sp. JEL0837]
MARIIRDAIRHKRTLELIITLLLVSSLLTSFQFSKYLFNKDSSSSSTTKLQTTSVSVTETILSDTKHPKPHNSLPSCWGGIQECEFDYRWRPVPKELRQIGYKGDDELWKLDWRSKEDVEKKVKVLYFNERQEYLEKLDRYFYDEVRTATTHPNLTIRMWGPGWPSYLTTESPIENIARVFGSPNYFDIIYTKTNHHNISFTNTNISTTPITTIIIHAPGDCHYHQCLSSKQINPHADAITLRYAGIIIDLFRYEQWQSRYPNSIMPFFFHSTDCADEKIMYPAMVSKDNEKWEDSRPHKARLFGYVFEDLYPLRSRIQRGILDGVVEGVVYKHPGYVLRQKQGGEKDVEKEMGERELGRETQSAYAKALRETQICLFDSSTVRKAIRKYHESFLSGCVVAADIPIEMESMFQDVVIPLRADMTAIEIQEALGPYLNDTEKLTWMAVEAFKRARGSWTCRNKVERLLEGAARVKRGERGYWFPFGFSATCRKYGNGKMEYVPEWCR